MIITNKLGLPQAIVDAIANDPYDDEDTGWISVTRLIDPPRIRILAQEYGNEIEEDASERIWALLGQSVHTILERAGGGRVVEQRFRATMRTRELTGRVDLVDHDGILWDYKVTGAWAVIGEPKAEWVKQLNVLAWLLRQNGIEVTGLRICAIVRDWTQYKATGRSTYPASPVVVVDIPMWSNADQDAYVRAAMSEHIAQSDAFRLDWAEPALCSPADRWTDASGKSRRCESYCPVRSVCDFAINMRVEK